MMTGEPKVAAMAMRVPLTVPSLAAAVSAAKAPGEGEQKASRR